MIALFRWVLRVLLRRFGWVALVAAARSLARRGGQRKIDEATDDVSSSLPDGVVTALSDMPGDPLRAAGTAVAAGRSARRAAQLSKSVAGSTAAPIRAVDQFRRRARAWGQAIGVDIGDESSSVERQLWADYHRSRGDHTRADQSLLDVRPDVEDSRVAEEIWGDVPPESPRGRLRSRRSRAVRPQRVQRSYRRPQKPWDH